MLVGCRCVESCKCEAEVEVCRFETMPGFVDSDDPADEARAESMRAWSPWLVDEMLRHHDAWSKEDSGAYDARMAELLWILDPENYRNPAFDLISTSMLNWKPRVSAMRERFGSGLSPFDAPTSRTVDYKAAETLTHNRNGRGAQHTGEIGHVAEALPAIDPGTTYESIKAARLEHARRA
jgi:hypothetical protein